jgi:hypothetical protein
MSTSQKRILADCSKIAWCAEKAAMKSGKSREYDALRDIIARQEKEHRAFGRRLVGASAVKGRFSLRSATDYFVTKVLADGYGKNGFGWERQLHALDGMRDDYVKGAILMTNTDFRDAFGEAIKEEFGIATPWRKLRDVSEAADYSTLVGAP